jgi:hypothetical protein
MVIFKKVRNKKEQIMKKQVITGIMLTAKILWGASLYCQEPLTDILVIASSQEEDFVRRKIEQHFQGFRAIAVVCNDIYCKEQIVEVLGDPASAYVLVITDHRAITNPMNLTETLKVMEQTFAQACYFGYADQPIEKVTPWTADIVAWQYRNNPNMRSKSYITNMVLYRKSALLKLVRSAYLNTVADVEDLLMAHTVGQDDTGLSSTRH